MLKGMDVMDSLNINQAKKKRDNLVKKYRDLRCPKTGTGTENGEDTSITWPFFDLMDQVLKNYHNINPPVLVSPTRFRKK